MNTRMVLLDWRSLSFQLLKHLITREFPTVRWIATKELAQWLENPAKKQPLVLDARSESEYEVSHLKDAKRIEPSKLDLAVLTDVERETPIVVYCSVGYRSARVAAKLGQAGFSQVYNLEGSVFQWVNEGRSVYQEDRPIQRVHPYNSRWGKLLKPQYRDRVTEVEKTQNPPAVKTPG